MNYISTEGTKSSLELQEVFQAITRKYTVDLPLLELSL